jgi:hypothetical protein
MSERIVEDEKPDRRELPCDEEGCGGEFFLSTDFGEVVYFTCNECGKVEKVKYGW